MDSVIIAVTPPPGQAKGPSLDSDASVAGDFAAYDKRGKIHEWIEDIDAIDHFTSRTSVSGTEFNSAVSSEGSRGTRTSDSAIGSDLDTIQGKEFPSLDPLLDDEFDDEDDFFVEAAQSVLEKGRSTFNASDFPAADAYLREALVMIKQLAKRHQSVCDSWELRRMLGEYDGSASFHSQPPCQYSSTGVCAFHVHGPIEAEQALLSVLENAPKNAIMSETQRLHVSEIAHLLSQVFVKLGTLEKAYRYCEYALRGRRKVHGKSHEQSYESLALMARILEFQENSLRAESFAGMIPEAERPSFLERFQNLSLPESSDTRHQEQPKPDAPTFTQQHRPTRSMGEVFGSGIPPPDIPKRSPSRGSIPSPRVNAIRQESNARSVSVLSQYTSAGSSEAGDGATVSSISPPGSPLPSKGPLPSAQHIRATSQQRLQPQAAVDRPEYGRSRSHSGSLGLNILPAINEPGSPGQFQKSLQISPQPLRAQTRQMFVSELPGDSYYGQYSKSSSNILGIASDEQSRSSPPPDPPRSIPDASMAKGETPSMTAASQTPGNDRDKLPSQASRSPAMDSPASSGPTQHANNPLTGANSTTESLYPQAMRRYESIAQQPAYVAPRIVPDAQRSDFQHSNWSPLPHSSGRQLGQQQVHLPGLTTHPPAVMPDAERWANQQPTHMMPRRTLSEDGQSISSSYSDSHSTGRGPQASSTALPSTGTTSGRSRRSSSLLKVFRANSSSASLASFSKPQASNITYTNSVHLSRADTDSIKSSALTDTAMEYWQSHLETNLLHNSPKFVLMRPIRTALLQDSSNDTANLKAALPDLAVSGNAGILHIFIPLKHPRTSHVSLLLISPQDELACHYDPCQPNNRKLAATLTTRIATHMSTELKFLDVPDVPAQLNDKDSGVFVCMFMEHLVLKLMVTHVGQKVDAGLKIMVDAKAARKTMMKVVEGKWKGPAGLPEE